MKITILKVASCTLRLMCHVNLNMYISICQFKGHRIFPSEREREKDAHALIEENIVQTKTSIDIFKNCMEMT